MPFDISSSVLKRVLSHDRQGRRHSTTRVRLAQAYKSNLTSDSSTAFPSLSFKAKLLSSISVEARVCSFVPYIKRDLAFRAVHRERLLITMLGSMQQPENSYIASSNSPAYQRYQELARVAGISRAFTLSVKLGLYTLLRDAKEKEGV